jgi:hypothetical protein
MILHGEPAQHANYAGSSGGGPQPRMLLKTIASITAARRHGSATLEPHATDKLTCARICAQDAVGWDEMREGTADSPKRPGTYLPRPTQRPEMARHGGDWRRAAHNPEVEGSNPSPATKRSSRFGEAYFHVWV